MTRKLLLILFSCGAFTLASSQNLDLIGKKEMTKVNGGVGWNMTANAVDDQPQTLDPFIWVASGNLNFNVLGVSLPFTYSITNKSTTYTQPFNMTALHPSYKWMTSHIGITSMSFSPYTYSGLNFAGAGLELKPKKWQIKAFGGRLKKAVNYDYQEKNTSTVSYKRMGGAVSIGFIDKGYSATLILLKASDDVQSLQFYAPNSDLTPMDNIVSSFQGKLPVGKKINLEAEFANSLLTRNTVLTKMEQTKSQGLRSIVNGNSSTISKNAMNAALTYKVKVFSLALKYERIDPGYLTLGGLYFNNDLENITIAPNFSLLKGKLNIAGNTGYQRNNLTSNALNQQKRWVGNVSVSGQPIKNLNAALNYSNFSSFTKRNPGADPFYNPIFDTLNVYQISSSSSATLSYSFGKVNKKTLTTNYTQSQSENITGRLENAAAFGYNVTATPNPTLSQTALATFGNTWKNLDLSLNGTLNYNRINTQLIVTELFGPGMNIQKKWFNKKLSTNFGTTYNEQYSNGKAASKILNLRLGGSCSPEWWDKKFGQISFALNANYSQRFAIKQNGLTPKSINLTFNLNYNF